MGLILDSSIVVGAERRGETVAQLLRHVASVAGDQQAVLSAIGLTELAHAIWRAQVPSIRQKREQFISDLLADLEVAPYTKETALLAGKVDGECSAKGISIPSIDLLIGATALEHGYSVITVNLRHFRLIPGLTVIQM
jgi:predicted nucleic acid-binding protein